MGMFDHLIFRAKLPTVPPAFAQQPDFHWQTKSLDCSMGTYIVTKGGQLVEKGGDNLSGFTGEVEFYHSNVVARGPGVYTANGEDAESVDYRAIFVDGKLVKVEETARTCEPALPVALFHDHMPPPAAGKSRQELIEAKWIGKTLFLAYGGKPAEAGVEVTVIAENDQQLVLRDPDGRFKVEHRFTLGNILHESKADAIADEQRWQADWQAKQDLYDQLVKDRKARNEA